MAVDLSAKEANFVSRLKNEVTNLLMAYENAVDLRDEFDAMGYSGAFVANAFLGDNAHIDNTVVTDVFTSIANIKTLMDAGNKTNLFKIVR